MHVCHFSKFLSWLETNKLSLNIGKTKAMLFHRPQNKIKINEKNH